MKQTKYKFIYSFLYKQYCQNIQIFQDYDIFFLTPNI